MKFTEKFFEFPIKLLSQTQMDEAEKQSDLLGIDAEIEYAVGSASIPVEEILGWHESFSKGTDIRYIPETGFDMTLVYTRSMETYPCTLTKKQFEKSLNAHIDKLEDELSRQEEEDEETVILPVEQYIALLDELEEAKTPWYKKLKLFNK